MTTYQEFIAAKAHVGKKSGFRPIFIPDFLFDFQKSLIEWAVEKGRAAMFADCGLGKTPMELVWSENIVRKTNGRVLILTPLGVCGQFARDGERFEIDCKVSRDGALKSKIVITNYERLHLFSPADFSGVACDESAILKNFDGKTKAKVTEFMRKIQYRLLATATPSPNDFIELGTSSEALGELGHIDMLQRFFKADNNNYAQGGRSGGRFDKNPFGGKFRFRGHAERDFWRWVCSWARAIRKPSDLGFEDGLFVLPPLNINQHTIQSKTLPEGFLFSVPASNLHEQRAERRRTLQERCEKAAELATAHNGLSIAWCFLNPEGDLLEKLIPNAVQISGADSPDRKEEAFEAFQRGEIQNLVSKPEICGYGLNFQLCNHQTYFPSHSFEQWYQAIRRSWRFGQKNPVRIDMITSEGEANVLANLQRKSGAAEKMFTRLVELMNEQLCVSRSGPDLGFKIQLPNFI
jgi:hypothetical protein